MGVPRDSLTLKQLLEIAKVRGIELKEYEKEEKIRLAKEKAQKLVQLTLAKRNRATEGVVSKLGEEFSIPIEAWKIDKPTSVSESFEAYLILGTRLRLCYTYAKTGMDNLFFKIKKTTYGSWERYYGYSTKPCPDWDTFCKVVATYGGKFEGVVDD